MTIKPNNQHRLTLFFTFLAILISSCTTKSKTNQETLTVQVEDKIQPVKKQVDSTQLLKFTSGIRTILEDSKGNIWFGSHQEGAASINDGAITYYDKKNGLSDKQIRSIYEAKDGVIWFEAGRGLSSYDGQKMSTHTERNYNSKEDWKIGDGDLWFKGDKINGHNELEGHPGVFQYDGKEFSYRIFPITLKEREESYYSITTPFVRSKNGSVWFGTYGAAIRYDGSDFTIIDNEYLGLNKETGLLHIRGIMEDSKGNLWIANNGIGVFKYDGEKIIYFTAQQKLKKEDTNGNSLERVFSVGEDASGNIWFGTVKSGVWRYDGNSLTNFAEKDGLPSKQIWTIYRSKQGELWFAGANPSGVYKFNGTSFERIF